MSLLTRIFQFFSSRRKGGKQLTLKERFSSLKYLPEFLKLTWEINPMKTMLTIVLRIASSLQPITFLYLIKLFVDEITRLVQSTGDRDYQHLILLAGIQIGSLVLFDIIDRSIQLIELLLGEMFSIRTSIKVLEHTFLLDLDQLEDSTVQDKLERTKRQMHNKGSFLPLFLSQLQDLITLAFLVIGVIAINPWLIAILVLAIVPILISEA
jgi:ATP-binding cassette, subfamily B, bacterial